MIEIVHALLVRRLSLSGAFNRDIRKLSLMHNYSHTLLNITTLPDMLV